MLVEQTEITLRRSASETLKDATFTCTAERLASKLLSFPNSKWAELKIFTVSPHIVAQVGKRLDIPTFDWDAHLNWAQQSLTQWVLDEVVPDFPPFTIGSPYIVLVPDPSLPEIVASKEARVMAWAAIRASLEILEYIHFQHLKLASIENLLGVAKNDGTYGLSQIQKLILSCLRVRTDSLEIDRGKRKGWLSPWGRSVEWNPWVDFGHTDWFRQPSPSKRATLSRSLQNLVDRGLLVRQDRNGTQLRNSTKHTVSVALTELGYLTAKLTFSSETPGLEQKSYDSHSDPIQEATKVLI